MGFLYNFVLSLHFTNNALYPLYVVEEGGGVAVVGFFMGIFSVAGVLGRPLVGMLLDRYGVKPVLILGSLLLSLPALGYISLLGDGLGPMVWLLRIVQGVGYGAHFSATFTLAAQLAPAGRRNESVAMYGASGLLGAMVGPYLGEYLVTTPGLEWFFARRALIGIISAGLISRARLPKTSTGKVPRPSEVIKAFRSGELHFAMWLAFLLAMTFYAPITFLATIAAEKGIDQFSLYFTAWGLSGIIIRLAAARLGDAIGLRRILVPGFLLYGTGVLIIHFSTGTGGLIAAGIFCGTAHGLAFPAVTSLGYSLAPTAITGSAMAALTGMMDTGGTLTALALGPLAEAFGYGLVFPVAAASAYLAVILLLNSIRKRPETIYIRDEK